MWKSSNWPTAVNLGDIPPPAAQREFYSYLWNLVWEHLLNSWRVLFHPHPTTQLVATSISCKWNPCWFWDWALHFSYAECALHEKVSPGPSFIQPTVGPVPQIFFLFFVFEVFLIIKCPSIRELAAYCNFIKRDSKLVFIDAIVRSPYLFHHHNKLQHVFQGFGF